MVSLAFPRISSFTCGHRRALLFIHFTPRIDDKMLLRVGSSSIELNMWNPVYAIAPFILLSISIPLAFFAVVTTSIAISLLSFRALIVYFQLAMAIIGAWLSPPPSKQTARRRTPPTSLSARQSPTRQRRRRSSTVSTASSLDASITAQIPRLSHKNNSLTALIGNSELTRDFEGVGGWRVPGDNDEEALWMGINSRLQLPAETPTTRHKRSSTGGSSPSQRWSFSPEALRMSPVQGRARTPVRFALEDEADYFPPHPTLANRRSSNGSDHVSQHITRKSGGSSSSSTSAGITTAVKEAGE